MGNTWCFNGKVAQAKTLGPGSGLKDSRGAGHVVAVPYESRGEVGERREGGK